MIESNDIDMKEVYNHFKTKSKRKILKRSLTELSQKYTLDSTKKNVKKFKKNNKYFCPCYLHVGDKFFTLNSKGQKVGVKLQRAHVGVRRVDIINKVLDTNPENSNICELIDMVMQEHLHVKIKLACQSCNKKLESI